MCDCKEEGLLQRGEMITNEGDVYEDRNDYKDEG